MRFSLDSGAYKPERAHALDAGVDLKAPSRVLVPARGSVTINTGVHAEIPQGYVGMLKSKSGLNVRHGITSEGVIDSGYSGPIMVKLYNNSDTSYIIEKGDKITQLVVIPCLTDEVVIVSYVNAGERGSNGFGSTGK